MATSQSAARSPQEASPSRVREAGASRRFFALSGLVVTPIAFAVALLVASSAGWQNAVLIALVFAGFAAGFFAGLYWLAGAVKRDERRALAASRGRRFRASRTA